MNKFKLVSLLFISILVFNSCTSEEVEPLGVYENGFFVLNEGGFMAGNAGITYISNDYLTIEQHVFKNVNVVDLGDTAQSIFMYENKAYIIINGSNKIEVVNRYTMEQITTIIGSGINNPRYMVAHNGKGYISNWGSAFDGTDDFVSVIDLDSDTLISMISVGEGPEKLEVVSDYIFVALKGGYGFNNQITVLNSTTDMVQTSISVGDIPNSIYADGDDLYVLCAGKESWTGAESNGAFYKINTNTLQVENSWNFAISEHPNYLIFDANSFYYHLNGGVYKWDGSSVLPIVSETGLSGYYYGMYAKDQKLFTTDAVDYSSEGVLKVFNLNDNTEIQSITTGIIPNGVVFN